ncbi:SIMPL domain-containing protein [Rhodobacter sp. Har01]|uniref:SIMPL domain-containing protein n=1 Tax=Rhodobacter sp. Har01 TaxID=2883999 RepID=UPI001D08F873|nr:SIMPL domain-containing protein [Rhodobacter sp. Har01]MCB6178649.1 SIMPL domain-containing protein [Rhodobacter sp. Har01]
MRIPPIRFPAGLALALALPLAPLAAAAETAAPPATITITGEASTEAVPDLATLSIGVTTVGETAAAALDGNSAAMQAVIDRLKAAGIEDRDLQTTGLSVNPNWDNSKSSSYNGEISGYTASNILTVRIRALGGLGQILDAAVADGANTLNGLSFGLADPRPAMDEARKAAVLDARGKAELIAAAAGVSLGRVMSISEGGGYGAPIPMYKAETAMAAVPVQQGEVSYSASVTIVYEIAP